MTHMTKLSPTQERTLAIIRERGQLIGGDAYTGTRLATVRKLEALGLITLHVESSNRRGAFFIGRPVTEWVARPIRLTLSQGS
jgi:hypothetical protein